MSDKHAYGESLIDKRLLDVARNPYALVCAEVGRLLKSEPEGSESITLVIHITNDIRTTPLRSMQNGFDRWRHNGLLEGG